MDPNNSVIKRLWCITFKKVRESSVWNKMLVKGDVSMISDISKVAQVSTFKMILLSLNYLSFKASYSSNF